MIAGSRRRLPGAKAEHAEDHQKIMLKKILIDIDTYDYSLSFFLTHGKYWDGAEGKGRDCIADVESGKS